MYSLDKSHAPRERVSWNCQRNLQFHQRPVTLHVSVWVEIIDKNHSTNLVNRHAPRERVSWNPVIPINEITNNVTLHVSVWVEIGKALSVFLQECHAPRERVSWNVILSLLTKNFWKVTLHVSVWVEIWIFLRWNQFIASRSTWACELKSFLSV